MKIFIAEIKKIFGNRLFTSALFIGLIFNAYLFFRESENEKFKPCEYKAAFSCLQGMNDEEKLLWLNKNCESTPENISYSSWILFELRDECDEKVNYPAYLKNIEEQSESMLSASIFLKQGTFNFRNIKKIPKAYEHMKDIQPSFDISKGVILATENNFTDVLCLLIILSAVLSVMLSDKETGMYSFLFSTVRGRGCLTAVKLLVIAAISFGITLLMYSENLVIAHFLYGLGDLSRPVQSLEGFIGCNLILNVFQYLIVYVIMKFMAIYAVGCILAFISINTESNAGFYGILTIVATFQITTYFFIDSMSSLSIFRYVNLIALIKCSDVFSNYVNINFFGYPISLLPVAVFFFIFISFLFTILSVVMCKLKRNLHYRKILAIKLNISNHIHSNIWYEFYKSLILQKGFVVISVFVAALLFVSSTIVKKYDAYDKHYQYYTEKINGKVTEESELFLESENEYFNELNGRIDELNKTSPGSPEISELYIKTIPSSAFYTVAEHSKQIKSIDGGEIFYDTGYKRALGLKGSEDDMKYCLVIMIFCSLMISPLFSYDNAAKTGKIIYSTCSGKKEYRKLNILIAEIYGFFAAVVWIADYAVFIERYYGHSGLNASLESISEFTQSGIKAELWQYIVFVCILRIISVIASTHIMSFISEKCKSVASAVIINISIFALPPLLYIMGAKFMEDFGFNPFLSVNRLINKFILNI